MLLYSLVLFATTVFIVCAQQPYVGQDGVIIKPSKRRGCPLPPFPENGEYQIKDPKRRLRIGSTVATGTVLVYFCEENYKQSADKAVCLESGRWSANPVCYFRSHGQPCNLPPFPKNGRYHIQGSEKSSRIGEPVESFTLLEYACDEGFELSINISVCERGTWSGNPQCVPFVDTRCALPPRPEYGTYEISPPGSFDTFTPGQLVSRYTILEYYCDYSYEPTKRITICLPENKWSALPDCRPIPNFMYPNYTKNDGCRLPEKPDHGLYVVEGYDRPLVAGDQVLPFTVLNYFCEDNYDPSNSLSVCFENKTWSSNVTCKESCEMVASDSINFVCLTSDYKRTTCDQFMPHGSIVHSFCRTGYSPLGELEAIRCIDGKWDKRISECIQMPDSGKPTPTWNFGIFQETGGNVLPMCVFIEGQVAIRVPQTTVQANNQQRLPANYYAFEDGKFFKLPNSQLEQDIFDSQDTIQGVAQPEKDNKPKNERKPSTTTPNEIFPSQPSNYPNSVPRQQVGAGTNSKQVPDECRPVCDDNQIFGDFVASTLRNFNSDRNKRILKLSIQDLILEATKNDDYISAVLTPDTTRRPNGLDKNVEDSAYEPETDTGDESPSGLDVRTGPSD